jgi:hypothetical protein
MTASFISYVEKYGGDRQATFNTILRRIRFARWIKKATDTHSEYVIIYSFTTAAMVI